MPQHTHSMMHSCMHEYVHIHIHIHTYIHQVFQDTSGLPVMQMFCKSEHCDLCAGKTLAQDPEKCKPNYLHAPLRRQDPCAHPCVGIRTGSRVEASDCMCRALSTWSAVCRSLQYALGLASCAVNLHAINLHARLRVILPH